MQLSSIKTALSFGVTKAILYLNYSIVLAGGKSMAVAHIINDENKDWLGAEHLILSFCNWENPVLKWENQANFQIPPHLSTALKKIWLPVKTLSQPIFLDFRQLHFL